MEDKLTDLREVHNSLVQCSSSAQKETVMPDSVMEALSTLFNLISISASGEQIGTSSSAIPCNLEDLLQKTFDILVVLAALRRVVFKYDAKYSDSPAILMLPANFVMDLQLCLLRVILGIMRRTQSPMTLRFRICANSSTSSPDSFFFQIQAMVCSRTEKRDEFDYRITRIEIPSEEHGHAVHFSTVHPWDRLDDRISKDGMTALQILCEAPKFPTSSENMVDSTCMTVVESLAKLHHMRFIFISDEADNDSHLLTLFKDMKSRGCDVDHIRVNEFLHQASSPLPVTEMDLLQEPCIAILDNSIAALSFCVQKLGSLIKDKPRVFDKTPPASYSANNQPKPSNVSSNAMQRVQNQSLRLPKRPSLTQRSSSSPHVPTRLGYPSNSTFKTYSKSATRDQAPRLFLMHLTTYDNWHKTSNLTRSLQPALSAYVEIMLKPFAGNAIKSSLVNFMSNCSTNYDASVTRLDMTYTNQLSLTADNVTAQNESAHDAHELKSESTKYHSSAHSSSEMPSPMTRTSLPLDSSGLSSSLSMESSNSGSYFPETPGTTTLGLSMQSPDGRPGFFFRPKHAGSISTTSGSTDLRRAAEVVPGMTRSYTVAVGTDAGLSQVNGIIPSQTIESARLHGVGRRTASASNPSQSLLNPGPTTVTIPQSGGAVFAPHSIPVGAVFSPQAVIDGLLSASSTTTSSSQPILKRRATIASGLPERLTSFMQPPASSKRSHLSKSPVSTKMSIPAEYETGIEPIKEEIHSPSSDKRPIRRQKSGNNKLSLSQLDVRAPVKVMQPIVPPVKVLIVEDNPINQKILRMMLKTRKIKHDLATNGQEAVEKWKSGEFHIILMDILLPVMSGIEATKIIRQSEIESNIGVFPSTPVSEQAPLLMASENSSSADNVNGGQGFRSPVIIVALTASSAKQDKVDALAAGCNDFLTKPVDKTWLERKIIEWGCMQALVKAGYTRKA